MKTRLQVSLLPYLIMGFILVCSMLGTFKQVYAEYPGDCTQITTSCGDNVTWFEHVSHYAELTIPDLPPSWDGSSWQWSYSTLYYEESCYSPSWSCSFQMNYYEDGEWHSAGYTSLNSGVCYMDATTAGYPTLSELPEGCPECDQNCKNQNSGPPDNCSAGQ